MRRLVKRDLIPGGLQQATNRRAKRRIVVDNVNDGCRRSHAGCALPSVATSLFSRLGTDAFAGVAKLLSRNGRIVPVTRSPICAMTIRNRRHTERPLKR